MKRLLALVVAVLMLAALQLGFAEEAFKTEFAVEATGKTFHIYSWNDEFQGMLAKYYIPAVGGSVAEDGSLLLPNGDKIEFVINPNDNGVYQQKLDAALAAGEQIDMFLMEADYILKYVDSEYTVALESVGITEDMMKEQYPYTIDAAKDSKEVIKGSSWQAAPGLFLYRRSLAEKYLNVKTPEEMQEKVKDWDSFIDTARKVNEASKGETKLIASNGDAWQVIRTARTQPWVNESLKLVIDDQVKWYFDFAKTLFTENLTANAAPWSEAWNAGIGNDSVLGYFFPTWGIQWVMTGNSGGKKPGEGTYGDWGAVNGPQPYYWGGTWLAVGQKCENLPLAKSIIEYFTLNAASMKDYCLKSKDYVNNKAAVQAIIDDGFSFDFLGGQDHYKLFQEVTSLIDTSAMSAYDQNINIALDTEVNAYIRGEKDLDTALADFKTAVADLFPEISVD